MPDINKPMGLTDKLLEIYKDPETFEQFCQRLSATDQWTAKEKHFMAKLFYQYSENKRRG